MNIGKQFRGLVTLVCAVEASFAFAQTTQYWNPSGASTSFSGTNWYNGTTLVAPSSVGTVGSATYNPLVLDDSSLANRKAAPATFGTGGSIGIASLTFNGNFNGSNTTTIANGTASSHIYHLSSGWSVTDNASSGTVTFDNTSTGSLKIALIGNGTVSVASGATINFSSNVLVANDTAGAAGAVTKSGGGTLILAGTNTYSGGTTVSNGTLSFANGSLGSSGAITMNGGTLQWNGSNTQDVSARITMVNSMNAIFDTNGNSVNLGSSIGSSTSGALVKNGSGTLTLANSSSYSGGTTISAGTLSVTGSGSLGNTSGAVSVGASGILSLGTGVTLGNAISVAGTLTGTGTAAVSGILSGSGSLGGTLAIASGGSVAPGNSPGSLTVDTGGSLTFNTGSTYTWDLGSLVDNSNGTAGLHFDVITLSGTAQLFTNSVFLVPSFLASNTAPNQGDSFWNSAHTWTVVAGTASSTITGTFQVGNSGWSNGTFSTSFANNDLALTWSPSASAIPEPSTYAALLGGAALAGAAWHRRRQRKPAPST